MRPRTVAIVCVIALFVFLLVWGFDSSTAQGRKPRQNRATLSGGTFPDHDPFLVRARKSEDAKRKTQEEQDDQVEQDADMKSRSGVPMDRLDYMRRRGEMIALLRGLPLPDGVSPDVRAQAIRQMERQEAQLQQKKALGDEAEEPQITPPAWLPIGPAPIPGGQTTGVSNPVSGRVLSIAVHPTDPNIVYVGTAQGGLYRSLNGGTTWVAIMDSALSLAIGAIAIDPINPTTLFVGTGEGNLCGDCFFGVGLYRIRNADTAPVLEGPFNSASNNNNAFLANSRSIDKIVVHPTDNSIIYVGTSSGIGGSGGTAGPSTSNRGLFRSNNAQAATPTFTKMNVDGAGGGTNSPVRDIEFEPGNPNNLLVGLANTVDFSTSGVYRSTNALDPTPGNVIFTRTLVSPPAQQAFNIQLAVNKTGAVITVYAALDELDPACAACIGGAVKKSVDGGASWTPAYLTGASGFCGGQCFYDMPIAVDPGNPLNVLVGGSGDYDTLQTPNKRSVDGGTNWAKASTGLHPDSHEIVFAPSNPLIVYHGNDGGIFKSTNGGGTWTSLNNSGFSATQFEDLSTHPLDRNYMIGGTQDNGTPFLQANNTWKLGDFGDGGFSIIDQNAADTNTVTAYHTYYNQTNSQIGFSRAQTTAEIDPGFSGWPNFYGCGGTPNGIACSDQVLFYAPMAQGPGNPNTLYFGAQKLYRSANKGPTMPAVSQTFAAPVSAIGISAQSDNVRLVGLRTGGIFGTATGANPLVDLDPTNTVPNNFVARAVIDPNDTTAPYTAYVTLGGFGLAPGAHVYKTTNLADAGTTWTLAGSGIPDVPINAFAVDPKNSNNLYAGTDIGVYYSVDGGATWNPLGTGLPRVAVFDMEFQARNNPNVRVLRIATHGRGIWEILIPTVEFSLANYSLSEGGGSALITVTRTGDTSGVASTVEYATSDGSAIQSRDYTISTGTLTFNPGEASKTFTIPIVDDVYAESSETVNLSLSSATGATLSAPSTATLTITDNDGSGPSIPQKRFMASLNGAQETPPTCLPPANCPSGSGLVLLNASDTSALVGLQFFNLSSAETAAHIHTGAVGVAGPITFPLPTTNPVADFSWNSGNGLTAQRVSDLKAGQQYMNVHSSNFSGGEIRGQLLWNPTLEMPFFIRQHYLDFLNREPDSGGLLYWLGQINCPPPAPGNPPYDQANVPCFHDRTVGVSDAFFFSGEFHLTASFVFKAYRAAYGNTQPFPNPDPGAEAQKLPSYNVFMNDRPRVLGGANLEQAQLAFTNLFVSRPEFTSRYGAGLNTGALFVDAVLANIQTADGVVFSGTDRQTLIDHYNNAGGGNAGRAMVMWHLSNDYWNTCSGAAPCVPAGFAPAVDNRAFIDAEYNREFALTLYFGYLRRNPEIGGFLFWQDAINQAPVRNMNRQIALVCSFVTSGEYQLRFGPGTPFGNGFLFPRSNAECP